MKSIESRLRELEAAMANRKVARISKIQRDLAVEQTLQAFRTGNRDEMLEAALQACRTDSQPGRGSLDQRQAAVKAAFRCFTDEVSNENSQSSQPA